MIRALLVAALAAFTIGAAKAPTKVVHYKATVVEVIDGDTIKVAIAGWPLPYNPDDVRIDGIDTPEHIMPPAKAACEVTLGKNAATWAKTVFKIGSTVTINYTTGTHDKYGRLLGTVTLPDGSDYGAKAIAAGYARAYDGGTKKPWC